MYVKVTNPIKDVDVLVTDSDNGNVITVQSGHTSLVLRITPMERLRILQLFGSAGLPSPEQFVPIVAGPDGSIVGDPFGGFDTIDDVLTYIRENLEGHFKGISKVTVSNSPPSSPQVNDIWIDTN